MENKLLSLVSDSTELASWFDSRTKDSFPLGDCYVGNSMLVAIWLPISFAMFCKSNWSMGTEIFSLFIILTIESGIGSFKVRSFFFLSFPFFYHFYIFRYLRFVAVITPFSRIPRHDSCHEKTASNIKPERKTPRKTRMHHIYRPQKKLREGYVFTPVF